MMKRALFLTLAVPLFLASTVHALSYPPPGNEPEYLKDEDVMRVGSKLYLFHSGTDVLKTIKINDVLTVYREYPPDISSVTKATGKVRVIAVLLVGGTLVSIVIC